MTPEQIKNKVQDSYIRVIENGFMHRQRSSNIHRLFHGMKLYGRDAGIDFVETHLENIIQEAVESAGCKDTSLTMMVDGFGRAAVEGITYALRQLTALKVDVGRSIITVSWVEANPGLL